MARRSGFTLVELLITLMIGGVILALAAQVIGSHIRTTSRQEALQRLRDHWGRVNHLITTEAMEGSVIRRDQAMPGCTGGGTAILTIQLPDAQQSAIHYYQHQGTTDLWRCGPEIQLNGRLDPTHTVSGLVAANAILAIPAGEAATGGHELAYELTLRSRNNAQGEVYTAGSMAQTTGRSY
jgi:prepilin-type N-terminal cleavage/methylation domain-containing protein